MIFKFLFSQAFPKRSRISNRMLHFLSLSLYPVEWTHVLRNKANEMA